MGRILKKKDPLKKKKKTDVDASGNATADGSQSKPAVGARLVSGVTVKAGKGQIGSSGVAKKIGGMMETGRMGRAVQFLREVKVELKKVTWPTRQQTIGSTAVVLLLVMIISVFLGLTDLILGRLIQVILN
ncbi:MAG: preprotein translocase subunit SecE [Thermodesulfobacteriota bacterium]|nr:preprotein translocase subunit SecE [Thermodesulfobacteriota bacterium]